MISLLFSLIFLLNLGVVPAINEQHVSLSRFSGFYVPDISANFEPFASAWLITKQKFVKSQRGFREISNFEGTVFSVLGRGPTSKKKTIMTRDYFDFQVEHLSSTINILEDSELYGVLGDRLTKRAEALRIFGGQNLSSTSFSKQSLSSNWSRTVAIIPFSSAGAHAPEEHIQQLRIRMFVSTFWSLKRYNFAVVVSVSSEEDLATLSGMNLPIFQIYSFYNLTKKSEQPKRSLLQAVVDISTEESWRHFEFVYYSDADQILHMRHLDIMYDTLSMDKQRVLCPHRLQTMTLPKDMTKEYRDPKHFAIADLVEHTKTSSIILERGLKTRGSCCDDGRFFIVNRSKCENFWYFCEDLHAFTLMEWIKFGPHGWPAPLTTEHQGKCRYYSTRRQCDVPKACQASPVMASDGSKICDEIDKAHSF